MRGKIPLPPDKRDRYIKVPVDPELRPLIPGFLQRRREEVQVLRDALNRLDYPTIQKLGHTIHGVGGGYGFMELSEIAARMEGGAKQRHFQDVHNALDDLADHLQRVEVIYENALESPLVVCVDDESSVLRLLERALRKNGFRVASSLGGNHALSLIHETKPDLILMDIQMAEINGHEMCARLRESGDIVNTPVVFVTGMTGESDHAKALSSGAADIVLKPFDLNVLVQVARKSLQADR